MQKRLILPESCHRVKNALRAIPFGETRSYSWVAEKAGLKGKERYVARLVGKNPDPVAVPCHRVIYKGGGLGGFGLGTGLKKKLLDWERSLCAG